MTYLRFGIRDLLWAMVVVGLAFGWSLDHNELRRKLGRATYTSGDREMHRLQLKLAQEAQAHLEKQVKGLGEYARQQEANAREYHVLLKKCEADSAEDD